MDSEVVHSGMYGFPWLGPELGGGDFRFVDKASLGEFGFFFILFELSCVDFY